MYKVYPIACVRFLNTNQYSNVPQHILDRYKTEEDEAQILANAHNRAFNSYRIILNALENHDIMHKWREDIRKINIESKQRPYTDLEREQINIINDKMQDYIKAQRPDIDDLKNQYLIRREKTLKAFYNLEKLRASIRLLFPYVSPVSETTDNEILQCSICATNKKDRVTPCGHMYCSTCITKCKGTCPNCKKHFDIKKVIRVYID
jgi:hypothetical protein